MVIHREFRIPLPLTVDEYQVAQLYCVAQESKNETGGGEGVKVLENRPFENEDGVKGQYTHKVYSIYNKMPRVVQALAPSSSFVFHEKSHNSYPICRTEYMNEYFGNKFTMAIFSHHQPDNGQDDSVAYNNEYFDRKSLTSETLNISDNSALSKKSYDQSSDPTMFRSEVASRGPFPQDFVESGMKPIMCCYKYYFIKINITLVGGWLEKYLCSMSKTFLMNFHRKLVCYMNEWYGKTMDDIRELEENTKHELDAQLNTDEIKGTTTNDY